MKLENNDTQELRPGDSPVNSKIQLPPIPPEELKRMRANREEPPVPVVRFNVEMQASVPADFEIHAKSLGYTARQYLWMLAEDSIASNVLEVRVVTLTAPEGHLFETDGRAA